MRKKIKIKIVDLQKLNNFVVEFFLIWNHLLNEKYVWTSQIWNSNFVNDIGWTKYQNESCRSRKGMKLCIWQLFDLNLLRTLNKPFTVLHTKNKKNEKTFAECFYGALGKEAMSLIHTHWMELSYWSPPPPPHPLPPDQTLHATHFSPSPFSLPASLHLCWRRGRLRAAAA